jgi:hypothetical protein
VRRSIKLVSALSLLAAGAAAVLLTCAPAQRGVLDSDEPRAAGSGEAHAARCGTRLDEAEPALGEATEAKDPTSLVRVEASVATAWLVKQLDAQVPRGLASARRQPIGDPGEVTYSVTRGDFHLSLDEDRLVATVPIGASVSVCKPLGPLCPTYGSCEPRLTARASVPLLLGSDYRLGASEAAYGINEGCSILGQDATGEIRKLADARIGAVRRQLDEAVPDIGAAAKGVLARLATPLPVSGQGVGGGACARVGADKLTQGRPTLADGKLSLVALASGAVTVSADCSEGTPGDLPPIETAEAGAPLPSEGAVAAAVTLPWSELAAGLSRALAGAEVGDSRVTGVRLRTGAEGLAVAVALDGSACGEAWLSALPAYDSGKKALVLREVKPWPQRQVPDGLAAVVEARASAPAPASLEAIVGALDGVEKRLATLDLGEVPANITPVLGATTVRAEVAKAGLALVASRTGVVRVSIE